MQNVLNAGQHARLVSTDHLIVLYRESAGIRVPHAWRAQQGITDRWHAMAVALTLGFASHAQLVLLGNTCQRTALERKTKT